MFASSKTSFQNLLLGRCLAVPAAWSAELLSVVVAQDCQLLKQMGKSAHQRGREVVIVQERDMGTAADEIIHGELIAELYGWSEVRY